MFLKVDWKFKKTEKGVPVSFCDNSTSRTSAVVKSPFLFLWGLLKHSNNYHNPFPNIYRPFFFSLSNNNTIGLDLPGFDFIKSEDLFQTNLSFFSFFNEHSQVTKRKKLWVWYHIGTWRQCLVPPLSNQSDPLVRVFQLERRFLSFCNNEQFETMEVPQRCWFDDKEKTLKGAMRLSCLQTLAWL